MVAFLLSHLMHSTDFCPAFAPHFSPTTHTPYSALGSGVFLILAGACFHFDLDPFVLIISLCLFMGFFSVGMGAITFVVASELFPLPVRGKAMALTVFVNRLLR